VEKGMERCTEGWSSGAGTGRNKRNLAQARGKRREPRKLRLEPRFKGTGNGKFIPPVVISWSGVNSLGVQGAGARWKGGWRGVRKAGIAGREPPAEIREISRKLGAKGGSQEN